MTSLKERHAIRLDSFEYKFQQNINILNTVLVITSIVLYTVPDSEKKDLFRRFLLCQESEDCATTMATKTNGMDHGCLPNPKQEPISMILLMYIVFWCINLLLPLLDLLLFGDGHGSLDSRPIVAGDLYALYPLVVTILVQIGRSNADTKSNWYIMELAILAHALDLAILVYRMPTVWDHEYWAMLVNASFLVTVMSKKTREIMPSQFVRLARLQFALFYLAATFWKMNTSFFDHNTSCGTVLILELLGTYTSLSGSSYAAEIIARIAPLLTLVIEGALGLGMLQVAVWGIPKKPTIRNITVLLATLFHLSIVMLPVNSAGGFSLDCMTRFIVFFESYEIQRFVSQKMMKYLSFVVSAVAASLALIGIRFTTTGAPFDCGFFAIGIFTAIYTTLVTTTRIGQDDESSVKACKGIKWTPSAASLLFLSFIYAFVLPILGLQQMGAPTMYSNLRYYQGSNHYLVPTSILGENVLFGGELVRVISSTSQSINLRLGHLPSDQVFPPRVISLLDQTTLTNNTLAYQFFPLCLFNPHSRSVLMEDYEAVHPPGSDLFQPMLLPLSTVQQLLQDAFDKKESFVAKFQMESSITEDTSAAIIVVDGTKSCYIEGTYFGSYDCDPVARKLVQPPSTTFFQRLVNKVLTPYPKILIAGMDEEACMS